MAFLLFLFELYYMAVIIIDFIYTRSYFERVLELFEERGWHSRLVRGLGARGPEFDSRISHPCFDFFPFCVA